MTSSWARARDISFSAKKAHTSVLLGVSRGHEVTHCRHLSCPENVRDIFDVMKQIDQSSFVIQDRAINRLPKLRDEHAIRVAVS